MIVPALEGTRSILQSTLKYGSDVKRVVLTSSTAAIETMVSKPTVFTEDDWNDQSPQEVEEKGVETSATHVYRASKTLAEREAWKFVEEHKGEIKWDLVAINPPYVFGPVLQEIDSVASLNMSMASWHRYILSGSVDKETLVASGYASCDSFFARTVTKRSTGITMLMSVTAPLHTSEA